VYVKEPGRYFARTLEALLAGSAVDGRPEFTVLDRPVLDRLGYNPEASFALEPADGVAITERIGPSTPTVKGNHGQLPTRPGLQTGFIAEGAGIRAGARLDGMRLVDIAPTVAAMLDLDLWGVDGRIRRDLLDFVRRP
jgi:hypothetical protein